MRFESDHGLGVDAHRYLGFCRIDALGFCLRDGESYETGFRTREGDAAIQVLIVFRSMAGEIVCGNAALGGGNGRNFFGSAWRGIAIAAKQQLIIESC